jgi:Glycosyltransferase family 87
VKFSRRAQLAAVVMLAFAFRSMWLVRAGSDWAVGADSYLYLALARGLRAGCGFAPYVVTCGAPELMRTPGYPVFLVPFLAHLRLAILTQAALGALVCFIVARFAGRRAGPIAGILAAAIVAVDVPTILNSKELITEALFQAVLTPAIFAALEGNPFLAGGMLGMAAMIRPVAEVIVPLVAMPFVVKRNWRGAVAAISVPILIICAWAIRNDRVADVFTLTVEGPMNLYMYTAPAVVARHDRVPLEDVQQSFARDAVAAAPAQPTTRDAQFGQLYGSHPAISALEADPALSSFMLSKSVAIILAHPIDFAINTLEGFVRLALAPYQLQTGWQGAVTNSRVLVAIQLAATGFQCVVIAVIWIGVFRALWQRPRDWERWILLGAALMLILPPAIYANGISMRYRSPAIPFFAVLAGIGWFSSTGSGICDQSTSEKVRADDAGTADPNYGAFRETGVIS